MLEIDEGIWVAPEHVTLIKDAGEDKAVVYVTGQSALDGFVVEQNAEFLAHRIADEIGVECNSIFEDNEEEDESASDE